MNQTNKPQFNISSFKHPFNKFFDKLKSLLVKNFGMKISALFIAIIFWAGLITQDPSLTRQRSFNNVPILIRGEDTLKRNGLIVTSDIISNPPTVNFTADVPQNQYNTAEATNYLPRIDLSNISETGKITLPIQTNSSITFGTVDSINPKTVEVDVDKYVTQYRIPVQYQQVGEFKEGFYGTTPYLDPTTVQVSGPLSIVNTISKAIVSVDVSKYAKNEGIIKTSSKLKLLDNKGNIVNNSLLQVTSESVILHNILVTQHLYGFKKYNLTHDGIIQGNVKEGYEIKNISINPSYVEVAANQIFLDSLDTIFIDDKINVSNASESFIKQMSLKIPKEAVYTTAKNVNVLVEIAPIQQSKSFTNISIKAYEIPEGKSVTINPNSIEVVFTGPGIEISKIKPEEIKVIINLNGLENGVHDVPISLILDNVILSNIKYEIMPETVEVKISPN